MSLQMYGGKVSNFSCYFSYLFIYYYCLRLSLSSLYFTTWTFSYVLSLSCIFPYPDYLMTPATGYATAVMMILLWWICSDDIKRITMEKSSSWKKAMTHRLLSKRPERHLLHAFSMRFNIDHLSSRLNFCRFKEGRKRTHVFCVLFKTDS